MHGKNVFFPTAYPPPLGLFKLLLWGGKKEISPFQHLGGFFKIFYLFILKFPFQKREGYLLLCSKINLPWLKFPFLGFWKRFFIFFVYPQSLIKPQIKKNFIFLEKNNVEKKKLPLIKPFYLCIRKGEKKNLVRKLKEIMKRFSRISFPYLNCEKIRKKTIHAKENNIPPWKKNKCKRKKIKLKNLLLKHIRF